MHDAEGVGLAATQVGILRRFFVCTLDGEDRVLVNPVVTPRRRRDTEVDDEGCLSLGSVRVPVERATKVKLEAPDVDGRARRARARGLPGTRRAARARPPRRELMLDRTDAESRREALGRLRPRLVLVVGIVARIAVAATAPFGADVLERLAARHDVAALLTRPDAPAGRGRRLARAARQGGRRAARDPRPPARAAGAGARPRRADGRRLRVRAARPRGAARRAARGSTSIRRCCRAGAAPPRSSGRSWPATRRRA